MAKQLNLYGLSARVVLYFNRNPEEELSALDIAEKFSVPVDDVPARLRRAVEDGSIARLARGGGPGSYAVYGPGPMLLEVLGLAMQACAPAGNLALAGRR